MMDIYRSWAKGRDEALNGSGGTDYRQVSPPMISGVKNTCTADRDMGMKGYTLVIGSDCNDWCKIGVEVEEQGHKRNISEQVFQSHLFYNILRCYLNIDGTNGMGIYNVPCWLQFGQILQSLVSHPHLDQPP